MIQLKDVLILSLMGEVEARAIAKKKHPHPTGFIDIDQNTGGMDKGELWTICGIPSVGKLTLLRSILLSGLKQDAPNESEYYFFLSKESSLQFSQKLVAAEGKVQSTRIKTGRLLDSDWPKFSTAANSLREAKVYLHDVNGIVLSTRSIYNHLDGSQISKHKVIVIDSLSCLESPESAGFELKSFAHYHNATVFVLVDLPRRINRLSKRPMFSDVSDDAKNLYEYSDIFSFLHREEMYNSIPEPPHGIAEWILVKNTKFNTLPFHNHEIAYIDEYPLFANLTKATRGAGLEPATMRMAGQGTPSSSLELPPQEKV